MKGITGILMRLSLLCASLATSFAMAETTVGNGGDLVVCRDSQGNIKSTEMLDYFEGRELRGLHISVNSAEDALQRLSRLSPRRADRYRTLIQNFSANALFKSGVELTDVPDSDHDILLKGCKIEQLAIQRKPVFPEDKLYLVNKDLWDIMSAKDRAGLILHEIIYRDTLDEGKTDSRTARYFNSLISSTEFEALPMKSYLKIVATVFSQKVAATEVEPPPGVLCDENSNTNIVFVVDASGSNIQTDPGRQRIADVQDFVRAYAKNPYCRWAVISFGDYGATAHTADQNQMPIFVGGADIEKPLASLAQQQDSGGTPYRATFAMTKSLLENANAEYSPTKVVFISDGTPTDMSSESEILDEVEGVTRASLNAKFNTVFYGGYNNGDAMKLLQNMAVAGKGKFLKSEGHIDFGQVLF